MGQMIAIYRMTKLKLLKESSRVFCWFLMEILFDGYLMKLSIGLNASQEICVKCLIKAICFVETVILYFKVI